MFSTEQKFLKKMNETGEVEKEGYYIHYLEGLSALPRETI